MKNITSILFFLTILFSNQLVAQTDSIFKFDTHKNNISIGYDFKKLRKPRSSEGFGPMFIKYEHVLTKNIGVGAVTYFHYQHEKHDDNGIVYSNGEIFRYEKTISGFSIIPKINWHFDMSHFKNKNIQKFDIYLGVGLGYGFEKQNKDYLMTGENISDYYNFYAVKDKVIQNHFVATELNLGIRYYPVEQFGAYFELGFGVSRSQFGLIYKW